MSRLEVKSNQVAGLLLMLLLCSSPMLGVINFEQKRNESKSMENLKDEQVIAELSSRNRDSAYLAVQEVMRRGDRMIPLLLRCKGNRDFFYGYGLGHHLSGFLVPVPATGTEANDGSFVTIEVAALYLISAIYHKTTEFAEAPYLTDGKRVEWQRFNTPERVRAAWDATQEWVGALNKEGIEALRARQFSPLQGSKVRFWAGK